MRVLLSVLLLLFCASVYSQASCPAQGCGNGLCEPHSPMGPESCATCPFDCGLCPTCEGVCGNKLCEVNALETPCNCPQDCGACCLDGLCRGDESPANCPADCTGPLTGQVYDLDSLAVLANATVVCTSGPLSMTGKAAADGSFGFGGLAKGFYTCRASLEGYNPNSASVFFQPGAEIIVNTTVRIGLHLVPGSIVGSVINIENKAGLWGANISCIGAGVYNKFTANGGSFFMNDVKPGAYACRAGFTGYGTDDKAVTVVRGQSTTVNFAVAPTRSTIFGKVIDRATGQPVVGATVSCVMTHDGTHLPNVTTDATGSFQHFNLSATEYLCISNLYGYIRGKAKECLSVGVDGSMLLVMSKVPSVITGVVTDKETAAPIFGASVRCATRESLVTASTTDSGKYTAVGVAPASGYICDISASTYVSERRILEIPPASTVTADYALAPIPGMVIGVVRDVETGLGLVNFTVSCFNKRTTLTYAATTISGGNYSIENIPSAELVCTASGPRFNSANVTFMLARAEIRVLNFDLQPSKGNLFFTVKDSVTLAAIPSASVVCTSDIGVNVTVGVDTNGTASVANVRIGTYTCLASSLRYLNAASQTGSVLTGLTTTLNFLLAPAPGSLFGLVYDVETSIPLTDFTVSCANRRVNTPIAVLSNATGFYFIESIESGFVDCTATGPRYNTRSKTINVLQSDTVRLDFDMTPTKGNLQVFVADSVTGTGIALATVNCASDFGFNLTLTTDATGTATRNDLRIGLYTCTANADKYATVDTKSGSITFNSLLSLRFSLSPNPGGIFGRVYDVETNVNLVNFNVVCVSQRTQAQVAVVTNTTGLYIVSSIDVGATDCTASGPRYNSLTSTVTVLKSEAVRLDFALLVQKGALSVTVQDGDFNNRGLAGASVSCVNDLNDTFQLTTGADGVVTRANVTAGAYTCTATAPSYSTVSASGNVTLGNLLSLVIVLNPAPATISGIVIDALITTRTLVGASISCSLTGGASAQTFTATSDANGTFSFPPTSVFGNLVCTGSRTNFITGTTTNYTVARGLATNVVVALVPQPMTVVVTVTDSVTGAKLPGATSVCRNITGADSSPATTDANGVATISGLPRGNYTCRSSLASYFPANSSVFGIEGASVNTAHVLVPLPGGISVTVLDKELLTPVSGATVLCLATDGSNGTAVTDGTGIVALGNLPVNLYNCSASSDLSYLRNWTIATVVKDSSTSVTLLLPPRYISITGNVTNVPLNNNTVIKSLPSISISVTSHSPGGKTVELVSGDGLFVPVGVFTFQSRVPVDVSISLFDPSDRYFPRNTTFTSSSTTDIVIPNNVVNLAQKPPRIFGYVFDNSTRQPLANAVILINSANSTTNVSRTTSTNSEGYFNIDTVGLGSFVLTASINEYVPQTYPNVIVLLLEGDKAQANFTLVRACCGNIAGQVVDTSTSGPLVGAVVAVFNTSSKAIIAQNTTDANGTYYFFSIPKGSVSINVTSAGFVQSGPLVTNVQPGTTNIQPQQTIQVAVVNIQLSGKIGVYNNATNTWSGLAVSTGEVDLFYLGDATKNDSTVVGFDRVGSSETDWSISADWRKAYEIKCFDIPSLGAPGSTNYVSQIIPVGQLQPNTDVVVNCPMVLKPGKKKSLKE